MYKVNPSSYQGVMVLPKAVPEKFLKLAGSQQLRVIIYAYLDPASVLTPEKISDACGISADEAKDALLFWEQTGLLLKTDETPVIIPEIKPEPAKAPVKKPESSVSDEAKPARLSHATICARTEESEEVRFLFSEAQIKLGRTIGMGDQSSLLLLHDYYGLPVEVILSICEYARTHGKANNMNYIYVMGVDWSKREIDTIERADEEFKTIERVNAAWTQFCALTGLKAPRPTSLQQKYLSTWLNQWHFPMPVIVMAYEEMITYTEKLSFAYMNKTLYAWMNKGIKTVEAVEEERRRFMLQKEEKQAKAVKKPASGKTAKKPEHEASYNIEQAENKAKLSVPALKKREV